MYYLIILDTSKKGRYYMLPIKFKSTVTSKLNDIELAKKAKEAKKSANKKSNSIIDTIERIRQDVELHLGEYKDQYQCIRDIDTFINYIDKANTFGTIAIDTETTGLDPLEDRIVGLCLYFPGEKVTYVPINHEDYISGTRIDNQLTEADIKPILEKLTAKIIMHNAQFDIRVIKNTIGVKLKCYWDTQQAATLLNENTPHGLKYLHEKWISHKEEKTFAELFGTVIFTNIPIQYAYLYGAHDAIDTYELYEFQARFLNDDPNNRQDLRDLYNVLMTIEMPMVDVIVELEDNGVAVDLDYVQSLYDKYHKLLDEALDLCYKEISNYQDKIDAYMNTHSSNCKLTVPINLSSTTQLQILFYEILKAKPMPGAKKKFAVDADVMEYWAKDYPLAKYLLDYRSAVKLTGTYIDNIPNITKKDGRIHTHFNSNGAKTGRMSSNNPINLQNIPSHNNDIRKMFVGQTTYRDVEAREDNSYVVDKSEEIELQDGNWRWAELLKPGDVLSSGEVVKVVKTKEFKVLIGV